MTTKHTILVQASDAEEAAAITEDRLTRGNYKTRARITGVQPCVNRPEWFRVSARLTVQRS